MFCFLKRLERSPVSLYLSSFILWPLKTSCCRPSKLLIFLKGWWEGTTPGCGFYFGWLPSYRFIRFPSTRCVTNRFDGKATTNPTLQRTKQRNRTRATNVEKVLRRRRIWSTTLRHTRWRTGTRTRAGWRCLCASRVINRSYGRETTRHICWRTQEQSLTSVNTVVSVVVARVIIFFKSPQILV